MRRIARLAAACATVVSFAVPLSASPAHAATATKTVIVQQAPGAGTLVNAAVRLLGGTVTSTQSSLGTAVVTLPASSVNLLRAVPGVVSVTVNSTLVLLGDGGAHASDNSLYGDDTLVHGKSMLDDPGSLYNTGRLVNADKVWATGNTGQGIDVALIDSGVTPVAGLDGPNKIVYGPDLSFDSQAQNLRHVDGYGHGTHMAGIIAAHDTGVDPSKATSDDAVGIAPGARIVSVKAGASDGSTDVSQVIAGINWVIEHQHDNGLNIRVLSLSFGTNSTQSYLLDPIAYAAEVAWHHGIVVVVSAGNDGIGVPLDDPAIDPFVIAVGASDHHGTKSRGDDNVAEFSNRGTSARRPDLVAPGRSIESLRDPSSFIDVNYPNAVVGTRYFRGSGTSQATAVTAGAAALVLQGRPWLTPDQVKQVLVSGAAPMPVGAALDPADIGLKQLDVYSSTHAVPLLATQLSRHSTGTGSIDAARGTSIQLSDDGVPLGGEQDVMGQPWNAARWAAATAAGTTWNGGWWNGTQWTGDSFVDGTWAASGWTGRSWAGRSWLGHSWSGRSWLGRSWSDAAWTGRTWTGRTWRGRTWCGGFYG
jgi:serine protease AprX